MQLVGRPFKIKKQFIEDIESIKLQEHVSTLNKALLVMHAPLDQTVGIENAAQIFGWTKHPKSYVSLDDADHLISGKEHAEYAGNNHRNMGEKVFRRMIRCRIKQPLLNFRRRTCVDG